MYLINLIRFLQQMLHRGELEQWLMVGGRRLLLLARQVVEILIDHIQDMSVNGRFFLLIVLGDKNFEELANST